MKNSRDEVIIVEVQYDRDYSFLHRILWGTSRVVTEHLHEGDDYLRVHKVISVNLIYFDLGEGEKYIYYGSTSFRGIHKNDLLQLRATEKNELDKNSVQQICPEYYLVKINRFDDLYQIILQNMLNRVFVRVHFFQSLLARTASFYGYLETMLSHNRYRCPPFP